MKKIYECKPLLTYDGEMYIGLMKSTNSIYYQIDSINNNKIWKVLNCSKCKNVLESYLKGKISLKKLYFISCKSYEIETENGVLKSIKWKFHKNEIPYDDSKLIL